MWRAWPTTPGATPGQVVLDFVRKKTELVQAIKQASKQYSFTVLLQFLPPGPCFSSALPAFSDGVLTRNKSFSPKLLLVMVFISTMETNVEKMTQRV